MHNCRQFPSEHFFLNVKSSTISKMTPQSLENHVYKGLLHMIIDLELFKIHRFFYSSCVNALKCLCYVLCKQDAILKFFCPVSFIFWMQFITTKKKSKKNCQIIYKISRTLKTSVMLLFPKQLFETCCWTVTESRCSNSTCWKATYCVGIIAYYEAFILFS